MTTAPVPRARPVTADLSVRWIGPVASCGAAAGRAGAGGPAPLFSLVSLCREKKFQGPPPRHTARHHQVGSPQSREISFMYYYYIQARLARFDEDSNFILDSRHVFL